MKWQKWAGGVALVVVLAAVGSFLVSHFREQRHQQEAARIAHWFNQARANPPPGVKASTWDFVCGAGLNNSVGNCLTWRSHVPTAAVKKLADYLDATRGKDLQSLEGTYGLMDYIEAMNPHCAGYFDKVRGQLDMEDGLRPTPTPIRIP